MPTATNRGKNGDIDDPRREFLLRALSLGLLAGGSGWNLEALASVFGKVPGALPEGKSIFEIKGAVTVNGQAATADTFIGPGDVVRTGEGSHVIAAVGQDAFILRERSVLELDTGHPVKQAMRLVTGALLAVFGKRSSNLRLSVNTPTATIGIRGTGLYAESDPEKTYLCTCYGLTDLSATADPAETEQIQAMHHDAPRWILAEPENGRRIIPAGFINHTDLELMTIEALVGRTVPFGAPGSEQYQGPRREY